MRAGGADNDSGRLDSVLGVSLRLLDEFESAGGPTVTLRAAAIIKGDYDGGRLAALGNAANGVELAALVGKQFGRVALWAEGGVQERSNQVPHATFYELGGRVRLGAGFSANASWGTKDYSGNLDVAGPGFTPAAFQRVRTERKLVKLGLNWAFAANQGLGLDVSQLRKGRNTVDDDRIVTLKYALSF